MLRTSKEVLLSRTQYKKLRKGVFVEACFQLNEEIWGKVQEIGEEATGVFHLVTRNHHSDFGRELYIVTPSAIPKIISEETLSYGKPFDGGCVFEIDVEGSGWELVEYELRRYKLRCKSSDIDRNEIYIAALYAAEKYPKYFGGIIPPRKTPWGFTVRVKKVSEGVFFLETDQMKWVLALASPIWEVDLSVVVKKWGVFLDSDDECKGTEGKYMFYKKECCGPVIYELLNHKEYTGFRDYITSREALETQIYLCHPEYTIWHNQVQLMGYGNSDALRRLLECIGAECDEDTDLEELALRRQNCCLHFWPDKVNEKVFLLPD